jgi:hypothetical protein
MARVVDRADAPGIAGGDRVHVGRRLGDRVLHVLAGRLLPHPLDGRLALAFDQDCEIEARDVEPVGTLLGVLAKARWDDAGGEHRRVQDTGLPAQLGAPLLAVRDRPPLGPAAQQDGRPLVDLGGDVAGLAQRHPREAQVRVDDPERRPVGRVLGVTTANRVDALREVPTLAEAGLPLEISAWFGLMAPRGTPPAVIAWLNQEANKVFSAPDIRNRFTSQGATLPLGSPEAFAAHIKAEFEKWGPVIRQASIQIH